MAVGSELAFRSGTVPRLKALRGLERFMSEDKANVQRGVPTAESTLQHQPIVASMEDQADTHLEPDADQIVKVSHMVKPDTLPLDTPTDDSRPAGPEDVSLTDVAITTETPSV